MYDAFGNRYSMETVWLYQRMMVELKKKLAERDPKADRRD